jgi:hypothetical protein
MMRYGKISEFVWLVGSIDRPISVRSELYELEEPSGAQVQLHFENRRTGRGGCCTSTKVALRIADFNGFDHLQLQVKMSLRLEDGSVMVVLQGELFTRFYASISLI